MVDSGSNPEFYPLYHHQFRVILIGDSTVGKSSLLRYFTENRMAGISDPTVGVDFYARLMEIKPDHRVKLQLWDTAGQEKFKAITRSYYRNSAGVVIVYDITSRQSFDNVKEWLAEAEHNIGGPNPSQCVFLLVGHKADLEEKREVLHEEGEYFAKYHKIKFIETSALSGENVHVELIMPDPKPPVRGKTSPYGFFVKMCYEEHKKKFPDESVQVTEISKRCSEKWKTMKEEEKKRFYELAQKDAERYQAEVQAYGGEDSLRKKKRQKKDPNAPKKALSAFFFFSNEKRPQVQAEHPEWKVGQIAQELGKYWKNLNEEERQVYERKAADDKARYDEEMRIYRANGAPSGV